MLARPLPAEPRRRRRFRRVVGPRDGGGLRGAHYLSEVFNFDEFPYTRDSYPSDWLRTLEAAEALEADVFVPVHGFLPDDPRETRDGLRRHRQILLDVREAVEQQIEQGATEDEAAAAIDLPEYHRFQDYSRAIEMAVRRTYQELTACLD